MQLTENIHLVGGGPFTGFGLTPGPDCHVYLIDGADDLALIDCGLGLDAGFTALESNIRSAGFDPTNVSRAFLTHYHGDHAGGARRVRDDFGARLAASREAVAALEAGDEGATGLAAARDAGVFPEEARLEPTPIDDPLDDGDEHAVGEVTIRYLATPGHCTGHGAYLLSGPATSALFSGDAVFWAGRILLQAVPDCDLAASTNSIERLAALEFDAFLPGHGALTISGGGIHPQMAAEQIEALQVPKSIL